MSATIPEIIGSKTSRGFSIEVLPPLKGRGIGQLFESVDRLAEFGPSYINITTHRSELVYKSTADGLYQRVSERARPGTVAVAAALQQRYGITAVPHLICSGFTRAETEYALIDLRFLGITNLLVLRGDKARHESRFTPTAGGHAHAVELQRQINDFNRGLMADGTEMDTDEGAAPFSYGVAGYPEKHAEAPNAVCDIERLKRKVDTGADYIVTQMFFDNGKYFDFVERCRKAGIAVPIIPALKPFSTLRQLAVLPQTFHVDIPEELARRVERCTDNAQVRKVGVEWAVEQCRELKEAGAPVIHFYTMGKADNIENIAEAVFGEPQIQKH